MPMLYNQYLLIMCELLLKMINKQPKEIIIIHYVRTVREAATIHGKFYNGKILICLGIENPEYLIATGKYEMVRYESPRNGTCLLLKHVIGREYIEIHSANWSYQLKGCIAPCAVVVNGMGWSSKKSLEQIFEDLIPHKRWFINITENYVKNELKKKSNNINT